MKKTLEAINAVALLFMLLIVMLSVVFRVVVEVSASWTEELAQYTLIFLAFIGAAAVMRDEGHITITVFVARLGKEPRRVLNVIGRLLMLPFFIIFTLGAFENMQMNWEVELPTVAWMKIGYMYLVVFLSGLIMTFYQVMNLYSDIIRRNATLSERRGAH
ncbi:MAG: TRAP transporter small permease [Deltaproteobacteria bacterium]|nr:TRAP transporter small permease [Deltaproteobacteria bacterium]